MAVLQHLEPQGLLRLVFVEFPACTSLTLDAFQQLVPPFEAAFQAHMAV
jgi:hypothetical protein